MQEQKTYTHVPTGPASTDDISIQLYSEHKLNADTKILLGSHLTSNLPKPNDNCVLIIGGNVGTTTELLIPFCSRIDVVVDNHFIPILQALYKDRSRIKYTFYKEGVIGEEHIIPSVDTLKCQINIIHIGQFHKHVSNQNNYNVVLLQNIIVHPQINIVRELMRINHQVLITMIVPGKLIHEGLFELLSGIEANILHLFYTQQKHERLEFLRHLTGRRREINFWEIFIWKKKNQVDPEGELIEIAKILDEQVEKNKIGNKIGYDAKGDKIYETQASIDQYIDFHFSEEQHFGVRNFPLACAEKVIECAQTQGIKGRALDLGCSVGRSTIQMAKYFDQVVGVDYSDGFIKAANAILAGKFQNLKGKVKFERGDACNLNPQLGKFDVIFGGNLIDRLNQPQAFLAKISQFMKDKSLLILTSPYTWLPDYTNQEKWIGGYMKDGQAVYTYDRLKEVMTGNGLKQLKQCEDINFVIRQNYWVYQYTSAHLTYWIKE